MSAQLPIERVAPSEFRFVVPGEPVPKGRARHRIVQPRAGAGGSSRPFVQEYTPPETKAYEDKIRILAQVAVNQARWVLHANDRYDVIVRIYRKHEGKGGDADNYLKAALDGMNGVAFPDDRYVRGIAVSLQPPCPAKPRLEITVRRYPHAKH